MCIDAENMHAKCMLQKPLHASNLYHKTTVSPHTSDVVLNSKALIDSISTAAAVLYVICVTLESNASQCLLGCTPPETQHPCNELIL